MHIYIYMFIYLYMCVYIHAFVQFLKVAMCSLKDSTMFLDVFVPCSCDDKC